MTTAAERTDRSSAHSLRAGSLVQVGARKPHSLEVEKRVRTPLGCQEDQLNDGTDDSNV